ncbi:MAG: uncharacterized protein KVP18_002339 [Porospora cf. gigantea A]|uniref:uncharacterized protein n=1 Tax=Porospora cf. gigantea A TaxID=2853593 RepID=UPI00355A6057|nr:MAG: hypothetical protein KVP18_002339 [Porospora cf. gigantea A]
MCDELRVCIEVLEAYNRPHDDDTLNDLLCSLRKVQQSSEPIVRAGLQVLLASVRPAPRAAAYFTPLSMNDMPVSFFQRVHQFFVSDVGQPSEACRIRSRLRLLSKSLAGKTADLACYSHRKAKPTLVGPFERYKALRFFAADKPGDYEWKCIRRMRPSMLQCDVDSLQYLRGVGVDLSDLKRLTLMGDLPLTPGAIPAGVTHATFDATMDQPISAGDLPDSLLSLSFGDAFNQTLCEGLPFLTVLEFGESFDTRIAPHVLPPTLKAIRFGAKYNQVTASQVIPAGVLTLEFGARFNRPLFPGCLPSRLRYLKFGDAFDQPLTEGCLPKDLETLYFGRSFNQSLAAGVLPNQLKRVKFGSDFNHPIAAFGILRRAATTICKAESVKRSTIKHSVSQVPCQVQHLPLQSVEVPKVLPNSLRHITFGHAFAQPIAGLLPNLRSLRLPESFLQALPNLSVPASLRHLEIGPYVFQQMGL